jgi:hypothetical protein
MRFLTVKMDSDHIAWADKRKSRMKKGAKPEAADA